MIQENYNIEVNRGYICYIRSNNLVKQIDFTPSDFMKGVEIVESIIDIIDKGEYPKTSRNLRKCIDCCYRNICV
jgi:CRISPR-associated exonuclease Cas4